MREACPRPAFAGTPTPRRLGQDALALSLTSHLRRPGSPVRAFFVERLSATGSVVRGASAQLREGRKRAPLAASADVNHGRAGTAVDYLLRFALAPDPCPAHSAGRKGAGMLGRDASMSAMVAVDEALTFVANLAPHRRNVTDEQWRAMTQISLLLATLEVVYRSGLPPPFLEELDNVPSRWREWTDVVCTEAEVEDVAILGWAATQDHHDLRGRSLRCNPHFAQTRALGGADADLLTDAGLLLDFKSTSTTSVCSRTDIWQLCGYALADTEDELGITSVGLSALRWRTRVVWPLSELLRELADEPVHLPSLRNDFAATVHRPRPQRQPRRATIRRRTESP
ncbi:MAG: hypothetical protein M3401_06140 [Actinomycetota bacterium]|nr:hypothetical protein [Actinomycetota bacterium]